jgi:hypothetical protein
VAAVIDLVDRRYGEHSHLLPMTVVLTARKPDLSSAMG